MGFTDAKTDNRTGLDILQIGTSIADYTIQSHVINNEARLFVGDSMDLDYTLKVQPDSSREIEWISIDPTIASIDSLGMERALNTGETKIIISNSTNGYAHTCLLTIVKLCAYYGTPAIIPLRATAAKDILIDLRI